MKKKNSRKKKTTLASTVSEDTTSHWVPPEPQPMYPDPKLKPKRIISPMQIAGIGILAIALVVLVAAKNGYILAAVVNGAPIFRWDVNNVLMHRYGTQTLDGMVTERLISDEAAKANIQVTQQDVDKKAQDILKSFGSSLTIEDFLRLQGMQKSDFDNQIKLQLEVQKLLTKDLKITDMDIDGYIASNRATLIATEPSQLKEEARQSIMDQKVAEEFDNWLQNLRQKASVQKFL